MIRIRRLAFVLAAFAIVPAAVWVSAAGSNPSPQADIFERRIRPIFKSDKPSSCTECHLAGVGLENYILPTAEKTFLSLRDQGLVDLDNPDKSRILALINMGNDPRNGENLITQQMREREFAAFSEWIKACAADPALRAAPKLKPEELAKPARPDEVIRHARKDKVLVSFENAVWSQRFRCGACHMEGGAETAKLAKENGDIVWLKKTPAETLTALREKQLIDLESPEKSLLLAKPTLAVKHGGGKKMEVGDDGYKAFRAFLEDYVRSVNDGYAKKSDLPAEPAVVRFGTDIWLKIDKTPEAWGDKLLQVKVFGWDAEKQAWAKNAIAISDRAVWGKGRAWQHSLILLAPTGSALAKSFAEKPLLPPGKYRVDVYVDQDGVLQKDWKSDLPDTTRVGVAEVETKWPTGYGKMTIVYAARIK